MHTFKSKKLKSLFYIHTWFTGFFKCRFAEI